jgi:hypothetical protein
MAGAKIEVRRYQDGDGQHVARNMRDDDKREIAYFAMLRPWPAVRMTIAHAEAAWAGTRDGEVGCIFGINRKGVFSDIGVPWLLGTPLLDLHSKRLLKESRVYYERMERAFPKMENWVLAENKRSVQWLSWLGFDMHEPTPIGPAGKEFIRFTKGL